MTGEAWTRRATALTKNAAILLTRMGVPMLLLLGCGAFFPFEFRFLDRGFISATTSLNVDLPHVCWAKC